MGDGSLLLSALLPDRAHQLGESFAIVVITAQLQYMRLVCQTTPRRLHKDTAIPTRVGVDVGCLLHYTFPVAPQPRAAQLV